MGGRPVFLEHLGARTRHEAEILARDSHDGGIEAASIVPVPPFTADATANCKAVSDSDGSATVVPGAGHFPWVDQPAAFRAAVDPFLLG